MSAIRPSFQGEVQFRRYSDTSTQGQQVVFAVADREALSAFIGKEGKRFMAVLVEIGDDEQPVQPPFKRGPLCIEACDLCKLPEFWQWLRLTGFAVITEQGAKEWMQGQCMGISSRKELDHDRDAATIFVEQIRIPFMKWQRDRK